MAERKYWLFKSEPSSYSLANLLNEPDQTAEWDGVRNYQTRNFMRDEMKAGDGVLFYHSSTNPMAVIGTARITWEAYPNPTAWDSSPSIMTPRARRTTPPGSWLT
jgi:predicted RNA-binding protein with PUA-like domain